MSMERSKSIGAKVAVLGHYHVCYDGSAMNCLPLYFIYIYNHFKYKITNYNNSL